MGIRPINRQQEGCGLRNPPGQRDSDPEGGSEPREALTCRGFEENHRKDFPNTSPEKNVNFIILFYRWRN